MAYSDYGGFCWKNGKRYRKGEDGTLAGITAPRQRPLEKATGLKLDVLMNAYKKQGAKYNGSDKENEKIDWLTQHPHHAVVGGLEGLAIVAHKQDATIVWDGKPIRSFPEYNKDYNIKRRDIKGEKEGYRYWFKKVSGRDFERAGGIVFKMLTPRGTEYTGVSGYGVGSHWWKEDDGREFLYPGERPEKIMGEIDWTKDDDALEEDKKKYNLTGDDEYKPIGFKPRIHWPTYKEWEKYVRNWAEKCE